jgi:LPS O-antigen subunit length determinant protein (WzzB/FepE family)
LVAAPTSPTHPRMNPRRVFKLLILGILIGLVIFFRP